MGREDEIIERHIRLQPGQLLHTGDDALGAEGNIPAVRPQPSRHHLDQGGFAAAIYADQADVILRSHLKRYIGKQNALSEFLPNLYNIHDSHTFPYAVYHTMLRMGTFCKKFKLCT